MPDGAATSSCDQVKSPMPDAARAARSPIFEAEALASLDSLYRTALRSDPGAGGCRGSGAGHVFEGVSGGQFIPAGHQSASVAVHDPAQHRQEPGEGSAREPVTIDSETVERAADLSSQRGETPETLLMRDTLGPELQAAVDDLPDMLPSGGLVTGRGRVYLRRNRRHARHSAGHGHVPNFPGASHAVRASESSESGQCLAVPASSPRDPLRGRGTRSRR